MLNFTTDITAYTTTARTARAKLFTDFASKKKLADSDFLPADDAAFITGIAHIFTISVHNDKRYAALTLFSASWDSKYKFLVVDLQSKAVAEVGSIKQAKAEITQLVDAEVIEG